MTVENKNGKIIIPDNVFTNLAGEAATGCFGVKGMVACAKEGGYWQILRRESMSKGVVVHEDADGVVSLELHIAIDQGINIPTVSTSIQNEVIYKLEQSTGVKVSAVDVFIDAVIVG